MGFRRRNRIVFSLAAVLGLGFVLSARRERAAAREVPPAGELVPVDGGHVHVLTAGAAGGAPIVALHGADGALNGFSATVAEGIAQCGHFVAIDRPGHGWSAVERPPVGHDLAFNVRVARLATASARARRPAVLLGHSYGAATALRWALDHPDEVAALVLISPAAFNTWPRLVTQATRLPRTPLVGPALTRALLPLLGPAVLRMSARLVGFRRTEVPATFNEYSRLLYLRPSEFFALIDEYRTLGRDLHEMAPRYARIAVPVTIIASRGDRLTTLVDQAEPLARAIPGATLHVVPGAAHELYWDHAQAVVDTVCDAVAASRH